MTQDRWVQSQNLRLRTWCKETPRAQDLTYPSQYPGLLPLPPPYLCTLEENQVGKVGP